MPLTLDELIEARNARNFPDIKDISIKVLQDYFEKYILPYKYKFICENKLTIEFYFEIEDFCHLVFGTIEKGLPNAGYYRGVEGYNRIKNGSISEKNMNYAILKNSKDKMKAFIYFEEILNDPKAIYFNHRIVNRGNHNIATTRIEGNFLLYKTINKSEIVFFLKQIDRRKGSYLKSLSFLLDRDNTFIEKQIPLKILEKQKENKNIR